MNGPDASLYLVLARTVAKDHLGDTNEGTTAFLVESSLGGLTKSSPDLTLGTRAVKQSNITFNDVQVKTGNLIGAPNGGGDVGQSILKYSRIQSATLNTNLMKQILKNLADFGINEKVGLDVPAMQLESMREKVSKITCWIYASESMTYLTTGLIDGYENQDIELESACLRSFATERLWETATTMSNLVGPKTLIAGEETETFLRNAAQFLTQRENIDNLKMFIGLSGLQFAGVSVNVRLIDLCKRLIQFLLQLNINETVKKVRNPLMNPGFIFGRMFDRRNIDAPKLTLKLNEDLHPTLDPAAQWLETSIARVQMVVEILLTRFGPEVIQKQIDIIRLADCAVLLYAMFASISRASRSYCIGLKNSDYEMMVANIFCLDSMERIKILTHEISNGPYITNDMNHQKVAEQLFKAKGYFLEHPTTHNF